MITKYKTNYGKDKITVVEIDRETESSVWMGSQRTAKMGEFACYFGSFDEAKSYLMSEAESNLRVARNSLQRAQDKLGNIKGMKGPAR